MDLRRRRWLIPASFAAAAAAFVGSTAYTQYRLERISEDAITISSNAAPSIEHLADARSDLLRVEQLARAVLRAGPESSSRLLTRLARVQSELDEQLRVYLAFPMLPGEHDYWLTVRRELSLLDAAVEAFIASVRTGDTARAESELRLSMEPALARAGGAILQTVEYEARQSQALAHEVERVLTRTRTLAVVLDAASALLAITAGLVAVRVYRRSVALLLAQNRASSDLAAELDLFAGRVAHDILSPLTSVQLAVSGLQGELGPSVKSHAFLSQASRNIDRIRRLVDDLLAFAQASQGGGQGSACDLETVLADLWPDLAAAAVERGVRLALVPAPPLSVACSAGVLTSIVDNLVRNAIKHIGTTGDGKVLVRAHELEGRVRLEVEDNGPGIVPELQERVFEPFRRGATSAGGHGLGLATVKRLVEKHQGSIGLRSRAGEGTVFWLELPRA
jgi:signal transduction histidine kinase